MRFLTNRMSLIQRTSYANAGFDSAMHVDRLVARDAVLVAIGRLTPERRAVVSYYFGLNGGLSYFSDEIARILKISSRRVHCLREVAILRLRMNRQLAATFRQIYPTRVDEDLMPPIE
ncbi:MAG: hypothetical protein ACKV2Q_07205 [Planctomycetaceae bacterium]